MSKASAKGAGARTRARELMVQALYQKQIAGHTTSELVAQFHEQAAYERVDQAYFDEQFPAISKTQKSLEQKIDALIDRPLDQLDPVELAILLIGVYELESRIEIPYRVVINEAVNLAKRFASIEGHKYVNACLDLAAKTYRETETRTKG
ncbi:MAG: transcription antitermination factor NusB [Gammaproteobacteria bacterium]|nr:transcription antitermination factor NusB [Gammaproteobacteria bacterium]MDH5239397.1 transcription antitermination factor NusB [Gammaproteobacteria bacterium]MDH5260517.1 transcription antitermination factor NusB [Gammaproteobacteria bacterium]MDH5584073.1 transcription antitermination factor NusB [Gammaproteobacteria bacterium]